MRKVLWTDDDVEFLKLNYSKMKRKEIAKILGRTECSISSKVCELNIRLYEPLSISVEELYRLYHIELMSTVDIANLLNTTHDRVYWLFVKHNIPTREIKDASLLVNHTNTRKKQKEYVGEMHDRYWKSVEKSAAQRKIDVAITPEYAWELFLKQDRRCYYTDLELTFTIDYHKLSNLQTASLDRIDSSEGYIDGNVQWVHKRVNSMKSNMTDAEFIEWCHLISKKFI